MPGITWKVSNNNFYKPGLHPKAPQSLCFTAATYQTFRKCQLGPLMKDKHEEICFLAEKRKALDAEGLGQGRSAR